MLTAIIRKNLCQNLCPYYKPSKADNLACKGFLVVKELLKKGKKIPFDKIRKKLNAITENKLVQKMCMNCYFYENDCDFVSTYPLPPLSKEGQRGDRDVKENPQPCGGFILLGHLIERNIISIDDIKNII